MLQVDDGSAAARTLQTLASITPTQQRTRRAVRSDEDELGERGHWHLHAFQGTRHTSLEACIKAPALQSRASQGTAASKQASSPWHEASSTPAAAKCSLLQLQPASTQPLTAHMGAGDAAGAAQQAAQEARDRLERHLRGTAATQQQQTLQAGPSSGQAAVPWQPTGLPPLPPRTPGPRNNRGSFQSSAVQASAGQGTAGQGTAAAQPAVGPPAAPPVRGAAGQAQRKALPKPTPRKAPKKRPAGGAAGSTAKAQAAKRSRVESEAQPSEYETLKELVLGYPDSATKRVKLPHLARIEAQVQALREAVEKA